MAEVPFDSAYKFMATVHHLPLQDGTDGAAVFLLVKGAPDVVLGRSTTFRTRHGSTVPMEQRRNDVIAANERLHDDGLRGHRVQNRVHRLCGPKGSWSGAHELPPLRSSLEGGRASGESQEGEASNRRHGAIPLHHSFLALPCPLKGGPDFGLPTSDIRLPTSDFVIGALVGM